MNNLNATVSTTGFGGRVKTSIWLIFSHPISWLYLCLLPMFQFFIITWETGSLALISQFGVFFLLGLVGALIANSTGAGGGVVFIPFFTAIGITPVQAIATSMAIQSFGMTAGAISWLHSLSKLYATNRAMLKLLKTLLLVSGPVTVAGVLFGQYSVTDPGFEMSSVFSGFSITFGILLIVFTLYYRQRSIDTTLCLPSWRFSRTLLLVLVCFAGGMVTAWISIGVGEFAALLLFFLRFPIAIAVAIGVYVSAVSVLTGVVHHIVVLQSVHVEILLFAGQAALIGGYVARYITHYLGAERLKLFFASWIILSGIFID